MQRWQKSIADSVWRCTINDLAARLTANNLLQLAFVLGIVALFALLGRFVLYLLDSSVRQLSKRTGSTINEVIYQAIRTPLLLLIILLGITSAVQQTALVHPGQQATIDGVLFVAYALLTYVALYRFLRDTLDWYMHEKVDEQSGTIDRLVLPFLRRVLLIVLTVGTAVTILHYFELPIGAFLATLGVGSLAVALAAQAALSDVISGFLILLDSRYRIGDRIELPGQNIKGDVVDFGLNTTRILTLDSRTIIVPNTMIANNVLINHAYPDPSLRVDLPVGVAYGTDVTHVKEILLEAVSQVEGVQLSRSPDIVFRRFGESAVELEARCWINAFTDKPKMTDRINQAMYTALNEAGIEIPFPQRTLWHRVEESAVPALHAALNGQLGEHLRQSTTAEPGRVDSQNP